MARAKKKKGERYIDRWMKGKRKMTLIMKEEEFETIKKFCDANRISYREFFVEVAPRLLRENEELRKAVAERESQLSLVTGKYNDLVEKHNALLQKYRDLKAEYDKTYEEYEALQDAYNKVKAELTETRAKLQDSEAKLSKANAELSKANAELSRVKEVLDILLRHAIEVEAEYCPKLEQYGFHVVQKEVSVGFMKKSVVSVCTNS